MNARQLVHVCPLCRIFDPSWFAHRRECPLSRGTGAIVRPAVVAACWRRRAPVVREVKP